ncbi:MAG: Hpt domain-containing protein [Bacteroidota bacterium]
MQEQPNLDYIEALAGGEEDFKKKFINILKEEFPEEKEEYLNNLKKDLPREASLNVHKLKHKLSILGLSESYVLAVDHEEALREGSREYEGAFLKILENIERFLKTI